ncbi:unnamed protein product [Sphagnum balticum]
MPVVDSGRNTCSSGDPWWKWIPDKMDAAISSQVPHAAGPLPAVFTSIAGMQKCFWLLLYGMPLALQLVV